MGTDVITQLETIRLSCDRVLSATPNGKTAWRLTRAIDGLTRAITSLKQIELDMDDGQPPSPERNTHISGAGHSFDR